MKTNSEKNKELFLKKKHKNILKINYKHEFYDKATKMWSLTKTVKTL